MSTEDKRKTAGIVLMLVKKWRLKKQAPCNSAGKKKGKLEYLMRKINIYFDNKLLADIIPENKTQPVVSG